MLSLMSAKVRMNLVIDEFDDEIINFQHVFHKYNRNKKPHNSHHIKEVLAQLFIAKPRSYYLNIILPAYCGGYKRFGKHLH